MAYKQLRIIIGMGYFIDMHLFVYTHMVFAACIYVYRYFGLANIYFAPNTSTLVNANYLQLKTKQLFHEQKIHFSLSHGELSIGIVVFHRIVFF